MLTLPVTKNAQSHFQKDKLIVLVQDGNESLLHQPMAFDSAAIAEGSELALGTPAYAFFAIMYESFL